MPINEQAIIRNGTVDDAEDIHRMLYALAEHLGDLDHFHSTVEDIRHHGFGENPAFQVIVGDQAGRLVGMSLFFEIFSTWMGKRGVYIQDLYVDETQRGTGLGRRLISHVAALSRKNEGGYLSLAVDSNNHDAKNFYERMGMSYHAADHVYKAMDDEFITLSNTE